MTVYYSYEAETKLNIPYKVITEDVIKQTLSYLKCPYEPQVSVTFTDDAGIKEINKEFRNIDKPTDVLSFPSNDFVNGKFSKKAEFDPDSGELVLGDIVLSVDKIISQANEYGHTRKRELAFLVCHSVLHLCGFDHMEEKDRIKMEKLQKDILDKAGYKRD